MLRGTLTALLAWFGLLLSAVAIADEAAGAPDMILHNAHVITVDAEFSIAQAAAIKNGRFIAVSTDASILQMAGPRTRVVDMQGQTVLPGFADTHLHVASRGFTFNYQVDLTDIRSIADIQDAVRRRASTVPAGQWIFGSRGWWEYELSDGRLPTRVDLDEAAPNHPVAIPGPHYNIVNSEALRLLGITQTTPDPQGGRIMRDEAGELTGQLFNQAAAGLARFAVRQGEAELKTGVRSMVTRLNRFGLTSVREPGCSQEMVDIYLALLADNALTARVHCAYSMDPNTPVDELDDAFAALGPPGRRYGEGMFLVDGVKIALDGAERTGLMRRDYPFEAGYRGLERVKTEQLREFAKATARYGWRLSPHVVGDAAIDQALDAFEYADRHYPIRDRRWMLEHAFLLMPDHYAQVRDLGLIVNSQYMHNFQLGLLILQAWERPMADMMQRYRDWVDNGILFANGADGPISYHAQPILYIYGTVTRNTGWGGSLGPDQGLSREEAIRSVTINSAHTSFEENVKGSIEPGKYADFVVLSDDILAVEAGAIRDIEVTATVLGGQLVFGQLVP